MLQASNLNHNLNVISMTAYSVRSPCRICHEFGKLSFEHILTHSIGNDKPTKSYKVADIAEANHSLSLDGRHGLRYR